MEKNDIRAIVVHPQKQGSYILSSSLQRCGYLRKFITAFYFKPFSVAAILRFFAPQKYKARIDNSRIPNVPDQKVKLICQLSALKVKRAYRSAVAQERIRINERFNERFGRKAAKFCVKKGASIVFSSIKNSHRLFTIIKSARPECKTVLELSSNAPRFAISLFQKDISLYPDSPLSGEIGGEYIGNEAEYALADYFLCPSKITAAGIATLIGRKDNIFVLPRYYENRNYSFFHHSITSGALKIVYVGSITAMKGVHHLCNACKRLLSFVDVQLVGDPSPSFKRMYEGIPNIHFVGRLNQDKINTLFHQSDLFVFPSLADAIGMAAIEAMYSGLPVLCSIYAGASDFITEGENGFLFDPLDETKLEEKLLALSGGYRSLLPSIGAKAHETILGYSKESYDKRLAEIVRSILGKTK